MLPPLTVSPAALKPTGASLKVKVTSDVVPATLSAASAMTTVTLGALVSTL